MAVFVCLRSRTNAITRTSAIVVATRRCGVTANAAAALATIVTLFVFPQCGALSAVSLRHRQEPTDFTNQDALSSDFDQPSYSSDDRSAEAAAAAVSFERAARLQQAMAAQQAAGGDPHLSLDVATAIEWSTEDQLYPERRDQGSLLLSGSPKPRPKTILIVCLQSSGCSLFAKLLAQRRGTLVYPDMHVYVQPNSLPAIHDLDTEDVDFVVLKTTIQGDEVADPLERLQQMKARFKPDKTVLFLRHPGNNLMHLVKHSLDKVDTDCAPHELSNFGYGSRCGSPQGKLRSLEVLWQEREDIFDAIVCLTDLIADKSRWDELIWTMNAIGYPLDRGHFAMSVSNVEVAAFAKKRQGKASFPWGMGDASDGPLLMHSLVECPPEILPQVEELCPTLMQQFPLLQSAPVRAQSPLNSEARAWFRRRAGHSRTVTLLFSNSDYAEALLNWFLVARSTGAIGQNFAIVCLDNLMESLLRAHGEDCFPARPNFYMHLDGSIAALGPLWMLRLRIVQDLLDEGLDIVLSDSDALWLKDPFPAISKAVEETRADVVASRGRHPANVLKNWGTTACMGFVFFRSTSGSKVLLQEMLAFARRSMIFDDQVLLNTVLMNAGVSFPKKLKFEGSDKVEVGVTARGSLAHLGVNSVTLALLPHTGFMRLCDGDDPILHATVAHCVAETKMASTGRAKHENADMHGLWVLPETWASSDNVTVFDEWIGNLVSDFKKAQRQ
eukprot:TRINITY_DN9731_c0_g3_i1.p1 TRINITY_DN9731_c0_g3~~TRINITY_DN9731_c0_g3_i1.p1  ORF type:complete len:726 (+),score=126.97 TRINITY_DN9731_c0_g3_i1:52-2229(+)